MMFTGYLRWVEYLSRPWLIFVDVFEWAQFELSWWIPEWNWEPRNRVRKPMRLFYLGVLAGAPLFLFLGAWLATCGVF